MKSGKCDPNVGLADFGRDPRSSD